MTMDAAKNVIAGFEVDTVPTPTPVPAAGTWSNTGSMTGPRRAFPSTLLQNGQFLAAGGFDGTGSYLATAEVYNPSDGTWASTGSMGVVREDGATATLLSDGRALIAGGQGNGSHETGEVYDPATGTFTSLINMTVARTSHTATPLGNGKVLMAGGKDPVTNTYPSSAELFDPSSDSFVATSSMSVGRFSHTATLLPSGLVLVVGGIDNDGGSRTSFASAELYDPASGAWTSTGSMTGGRSSHTATLLSDGTVLVTGGIFHSGTPRNPVIAEIYDPATGTWSDTGAMASDRLYHTATMLPDGRVLILAGIATGGAIAPAEIYDPASGAFGPVPTMAVQRYRGGVALLSNGKVLVAGGDVGSNPSADATELFTPSP